MNISRRISKRFNPASILLTIVVLLPLRAAADETPAWAAGLLPAGAEVSRQSLDVIDLDPGKSLGANMEFEFPGKYPSCSWSLYKQDMTLELVGQSVDETPWMLDQVVENYEKKSNDAAKENAELRCTLRDLQDLLEKLQN